MLARNCVKNERRQNNLVYYQASTRQYPKDDFVNHANFCLINDRQGLKMPFNLSKGTPRKSSFFLHSEIKSRNQLLKFHT